MDSYQKFKRKVVEVRKIDVRKMPNIPCLEFHKKSVRDCFEDYQKQAARIF